MAQSRLFRLALEAAHEREQGLRLSRHHPVTVREHLGALLLDRSGWVPSDLCDGVSIFVTHDAELTTCVYEAVARIYRRVLAGRKPRHDGGLAVLTVLTEADDYDDAVNTGAPVLGICSELTDLTPAAAYALPDREHDVPCPITTAYVVDLVEDVTGDRFRLMRDDLQGISAGDVLRCVYGPDGGACVDRLRLASQARQAVVLGLKGMEKATAVPAAPPAAPEPGAVRRLSEMTGFGEAGEWGCRLAVDLGLYRDGKLAWNDVDRGILLSGPPGGGKTTFAKALALECDLELVVTTYSEWSSAAGAHGDSMSKGINKLFADWHKKRQKAPFILFVDEIDSMGVRNGNAQNDSWFSPIINAWLAFLDGATPRDGIVIIAATNHPDRVDPGMRRPGRLDRHVELPMPDVAALAGIVRLHLGPDAVLDDAELAEAARAVRGKSPADVAQLCREARRVARWCGRRVCAGDLTDVLDGQRRAESAADRRLVCVHEAGHAVAGAVLDGDRLESVDADVGLTSFTSVSYATPRVVENRMVMMLAARAAEEVLLGEVTTGAAQDLRDATAVATAYHGGWGMGAYGLVHVPPEVAARTPAMVTAVRATLDEAYARALALVREHREAVERVAAALLAQRYLDATEVRALVYPPATRPTGSTPGTGLRRLRAVAGP